jgi:hypothetical protein
MVWLVSKGRLFATNALFVWLVAGADLLREKNTAGW